MCPKCPDPQFVPGNVVVLEPAVLVNREQWLINMTDELRPVFTELAEAKIPDVVRVSVGWPSKMGAAQSGKRVIGQCWGSKAAEDGAQHIFISPLLSDPAGQVGATLAHELVHAADDCESGHKGNFKRIAKAIGLEGKMTSTHAGDSLLERLRLIAEKLGPYPHVPLSLTYLQSLPKQSTRLLKLVCANPECGCNVRITRKWMDAGKIPACCDVTMLLDGEVD